MNSIRSQLSLQLLVGFVVLLGVASGLIYLIARDLLETDFDARLMANARAVMASTAQMGNQVMVEPDSLPPELVARGKRPALFNLIDEAGKSLAGNTSLLPGNAPVSTTGAFRNEPWQDDDEIRILTLSFQPQIDEDAPVPAPTRRQTCLLVLGAEREPLDKTLGRLASVLVSMTLLTTAIGLGLIYAALNRGLRPLSDLGGEVVLLNADSLEKRIPLEHLPVELTPIAEKLNDLLARLEVSFARERRFSADVSHELRTPVAELRSLSEIMLRQPDLSDVSRQAFQDVLDASCQMEVLVATLLEIVRAERNTSTMELQRVDFCGLMRLSWKPHEAKARGKDLKCLFNLPESLWVESDERLLRLVLNNLLANAVEYTPKRGSLEAGIKKSNESTVIFIQNSSQDIAPADLANFFERFWRKDQVRGNTEHLGLGLSLTQLFCQRLQIHLTVSMPEPNLVCFGLNIPARLRPA